MAGDLKTILIISHAWLDLSIARLAVEKLANNTIPPSIG
jgi:hypothetical protein